MTADEIRQKLMSDFDYTEEQVSALKGKTRLQLTLESEQKKVGQLKDAGFFSELDTLEEVKVEQKENVPTMGTKAWEAFVLNQLEQDEFEEVRGKKFPKVNGLRRVAQLLLGDIVESGPVTVFPPTTDEGPGRATVVYEVKIKWFRDPPEYVDIRTYKDQVRIFREAADAWCMNTPDVFAVHPVATASSRAEGRALKRALQLSTLVAEEMNNDKDATAVVQIEKEKRLTPPKTLEWTPDDKSSGNQQAIIKTLCDRLEINQDAFLESENIFVKIEQLTKSEASSLIQRLNQYQSKGEGSLTIPDSIKKVFE